MAMTASPETATSISRISERCSTSTPSPSSTTATQPSGQPSTPTARGGVIVDPRSAIEEAYTTGRGSFRVRAKWAQEDLGRGAWQIVVSEIPYLVQKGRLIEKIAELLTARKLPLLADVRDESAEDVRVVLEPRSRTVDPALLMESLFHATELEARIAFNMNVLSGGNVPKVMSLREALRESA